MRGTPQQASERARGPRVVPVALVALLVIVAASFAFRAPALLNAGQTNSDAAVVGLQAMHVLRGEWSPFLWGSGYQTSTDSTFAALFFALFGATPLALMLSSLALHVVLTCLAFDVVRRRTSSPWMAALLAAPLVFTSSPSHTYILYPPRQAALTLVVASFWLFDRAAARRENAARAEALFAAGAAVAGLSCFADPYALVLMPPLAIFALSCAWGSRRAVIACAAGGALGIAPALLLWASPRASHGQVGLTAEVVAHNARLLVDACLPWALGAKAYFAREAMDYAPWDLPLPLRALQMVAGGSFVILVALSGAIAWGRRAPWEVRRLGIAGSVALPITVGGFLTSVMVMDIFSARYLAAIFIVAPFALAPLAVRVGARRFAWVIAPYLVASAVSGWVGFGPFVKGALPVRVARGESDEASLVTALNARGVRYATADYWASYRLTLLSREALVVVPTNAAEDRYAPYRAAFEEAKVVAYVFDPMRSREAPGSFEERVARGGSPFDRVIDRIDVGPFTAIILHRRGDAASATR